MTDWVRWQRYRLPGTLVGQQPLPLAATNTTLDSVKLGALEEMAINSPGLLSLVLLTNSIPGLKIAEIRTLEVG